jgi:hypothetical protein
MATPKTDIEQSVGRILREKHSSPIVVDIIDSHDLFQNQWRKRKTFYKKENYKIIYTESQTYNPDTSTWSVIYMPNGCKRERKVSKKINSKRSNSSTDRSITNDSSDSDSDSEDVKDKYACGKCLLTMKK